VKPNFAHFAGTVPATAAAAIGVALALFLLPGLGDQGSPSPLLPAVGSVVGRVAADLPAPAKKHAVAPARNTAVSVQLATARPVQVVPQGRHTAASTHRVHRRPQTKVSSSAPAVPVRATVPVAPPAPATTHRAVSSPTKTHGKARGHAHGHGRALGHTHSAPVSRPHGHDKAPPGHSSEHHHGHGRGPAKKAPAVPPPGPVAPSGNGNGHGNGNGNGGGNGHKGGKK
jgi:hypothetical protein